MTGAAVDRAAGTDRSPEEVLLGFARAVRAAGVPVTADRAQQFLVAVAALDAGDPAATRRAGRATLCADPEDLARHDEVFEAWFGRGVPRGDARPTPRTPPVRQAVLDGAEGGELDAEQEVARVAASDREVLRHRDVARMDDAERARLAGLFATLTPRLPVRASYRRRPARRGTVDAAATLRRTVRRLGEPVDIAWRHRSVRSRRVVLLVDVSGSMSQYADALLRLAHRVRHAPERPGTSRPGGARGRSARVEVFSVGTRLTRLTGPLAVRDPERALVAAGEAVPDWSGGTRLGEGLAAFLDRWGQRGLARGAVVVVFSDGWERGEPDLLATQMARLRRLAHRVVWVNPHKGTAGYAPVQQGMAAALPHVDDFVAGHSLAAFDEVLAVVAGA